MDRPKIGALLAIASAGFALALLVLRWTQTQGSNLRPASIVVVLLLAFAIAVLTLGWRVRSFVRGTVSMDATAAARVAALAVSATWIGPLLAGIGIAQVVAVLDQIGAPAARADAWIGVGTAVASMLTLGAGLLALRWCRVPEDDDTTRPGGHGGPGTA